MAEMGTDIVSLCVTESHLTHWHEPRLRRVIQRIHAHGMKAHAVPNRWAGLLAGWLDGFDSFTVDHPETRICDPQGRIIPDGERPSCVNNPTVREHICTTMDRMFERMEFDGLIWDEPHGDGPCFCHYCREACGQEPTADWYRSRFAFFLDECSAYAKQLRPGLMVSLFVMPDRDLLLNALLKTQSIDYLGSDGHIRSEDHVMHRMKKTIFDAYRRFNPLLRDAGKKTLFLLEAQRHRDEDLDDYLINLDRAFALPMDHLMYYYCAQEMMSPENERRFVEATWKAVEQLKRHCKPNDK